MENKRETTRVDAGVAILEALRTGVTPKELHNIVDIEVQILEKEGETGAE